MDQQDLSILDSLLSAHRFSCQRSPATVPLHELVHVFGTQEPVRSQPDGRAQSLKQMGWLRVEYIDTSIPPDKRGNVVSAIQQEAREWLKQAKAQPEETLQQVRWCYEKTRAAESPQQIAQRVWLAAVLYNLGMRGLRFDAAGQILYEGGQTARIGIAPDLALDVIWDKPQPVLYTASFRQPDGTIWRGKGRQRWYIYCVTLNPAARALFERLQRVVNEKVALIVASETYAKRPQLPRDFYGGDAFQQACIDAQDQQFNHILVLSPKHGVLSLDDVVSSDESWEYVLETMHWTWTQQAVQRLGLYLYGTPPAEVPEPHQVNWWVWLNPQSRYELTFFGSGYPAQAVATQLRFLMGEFLTSMPQITFGTPRPGYKAADLEYFDEFFDEFSPLGTLESDSDDLMDEIEELLGWAAELAEQVNVAFPPTGDEWSLAPEEALIPARVLATANRSMDELLDLLTDLSLTLERPVPFSLIVNARLAVQTLLEVIHSEVHNDREQIQETLSSMSEPLLSRYIEDALQQTKQEDRLCSLLSLAQPLHLLSMIISDSLNEQLLVWLQTHLTTRLHQHLRRGGLDDNRT